MTDTWVWGDSKSTEYMDWKDTGCEIADACLTCPLPVCKHDDPAWFAKYKQAAKYRIIFYLLRISSTTEDVNRLAEHYNFTTRTIFRIKSRLGKDDLEQRWVDLFANCINETDSITK